ncbi:hypothetical protein ACO1MB_14405, partial [Staphylococcus aureus]
MLVLVISAASRAPQSVACHHPTKLNRSVLTTYIVSLSCSFKTEPFSSSNIQHPELARTAMSKFEDPKRIIGTPI